MTTFQFTIQIDQYVDDAKVVDEFYGRCSDATIASADGATAVHFDRDAATLDQALSAAVRDVQASGWQVVGIQVDPSSVAPTSAET